MQVNTRAVRIFRIKQIDIPYGAYMCVWIVRIHTAGMLMQQYMCEYFILITFSNGNNGTKISRNTSTPFHNLSHTHIHTCTHAYFSLHTLVGSALVSKLIPILWLFYLNFAACISYTHIQIHTHSQAQSVHSTAHECSYDAFVGFMLLFDIAVMNIIILFFVFALKFALNHHVNKFVYFFCLFCQCKYTHHKKSKLIDVVVSLAPNTVHFLHRQHKNLSRLGIRLQNRFFVRFSLRYFSFSTFFIESSVFKWCTCNRYTCT